MADPTDPRDPIDDRLRRAASGWQAAQPAPAPVDVAGLDAPRRRVPWGLITPAAAAAVVALVLVATSLAHDDGGTTAPPPSASSRTSRVIDGVVPWKRLTGTDPNSYQHTVLPQADVSAAENAPRCDATQLRAGAQIDGAGGTGSAIVTISLDHGAPCSVAGTPGVVVHTADGKRVRGQDGDGFGQEPPYTHPVLVSAGQPAFVVVTWPDACNGPTRDSRLVLSITTGAPPIDVPNFPILSTCDFGGPRRPLGFVSVAPFAPDDGTGGRTTTPFDDISVTGTGLTQTAGAGATIDFTVTLTASHDTSLDPCPDYDVSIGAGGNEGGGLNCAGVTYRDDHGRPYLPAGVPVTFDMHLRVPTDLTGQQKLLWTVAGPESAPGANGVLTIEP